MKTMTINTNGLENEGFRELTTNEMADVTGGNWVVIEAMLKAEATAHVFDFLG